MQYKPTTYTTIIVSFFVFATQVNAQTNTEKILQNSSISLGVGFANYGGDLQQKRYTLKLAGFARTIGIGFNLTNRLQVRGDYIFAKIGADDKQNASTVLQQRNLNFKANLFETALTLRYDLIDEDRYGLVPYVYAGIAYFKASPYTYTADGTKYFLAGLHTEGQGLPNNAGEPAYSTKHISIPFGFGLRMKLNDIFAVSYELGFRKTFTDYIDDVSGTYADYTLLNNYTPVSTQLAFRSGEVKDGVSYPAAGTQRGNSTNKDYYYFGLVKLHANLSFLSKNRLACAKRVL